MYFRIYVCVLYLSDCEIFENRRIFFKNNSFEFRLDKLCIFINNLPLDTVYLSPTY